MKVFCGTDGHFCSVGCQVKGEHRDWALCSPWVDTESQSPQLRQPWEPHPGENESPEQMVLREMLAKSDEIT